MVAECDPSDVKAYLSRGWFDQDAEIRGLAETQVKRCFEFAIAALAHQSGKLYPIGYKMADIARFIPDRVYRQFPHKKVVDSQYQHRDIVTL